MAWRDPILTPPPSVTATPVDAGSLAAGHLRVPRRRAPAGGTGLDRHVRRRPPKSTATSAGGAVRVAWNAVPDATEYRVYGRTPGGATQYWTVTGTSFTDTGAAGTAGAAPAEGSRWQVKNIFELKNARRVRVEYNLFENNWQAAQPGYAVVFTPRNQDGGCPLCVVESVDFTHNIVRNVAAGVNILGYDTNNSSRQTKRSASWTTCFST